MFIGGLLMLNDFISDDTFKLTKLSGIYSITNTSNNKTYIGESLDIKSRWKFHIDNLRSNAHENTKLQRDYNNFGEDVFEFKVLLPHVSYSTIQTKAELIILENYYIRQQKPELLYNVENSMEQILNNQKILKGEINDYGYIILKKYLVATLLSHSVVLIENTPSLVKHLILRDILQSKSDANLKHLLKTAFADYKDCIGVKEVTYMDDLNENVISKKEYIVINIIKLLPFLIDNHYVSQKSLSDTLFNIGAKEQYINMYDDANFDSKYNNNIPRSVLYNYLLSKGYFNHIYMPYKKFKTFLCDNNILSCNEISKYITPTDYALTNKLISYFDGYSRVSFTNKGKDYIINLLTTKYKASST